MAVTLSEDGVLPIRNGVTESASPILRTGRIGRFDMTLPGTSQGSKRPGQWGQPQVGKGGFQVSWWMVRTLGAVDVRHHVIQTTSPCRHPWETSRIHVGPHCGLMGT